MDPILYPVLSLAVTGMMALQMLGMLWAAAMTRRLTAPDADFQRSWSRVLLVVCWPLCMFVVYVLRRM